MFKKTTLTLIITIFILTPLGAGSTSLESKNLNSYLERFYTKHSRFLDTTYQPLFKTWHFDTPYYSNKRWQKTINHPRWHISAASFYKFRLDESPYARKLVRQAIFDSTLNNQRAIFDQSFNDAIADFLIVRLLEQNTLNLTKKENNDILNWIRIRLPYGLAAQDTENRAALAGVYWYYVTEYLFKNNYLTIKEFDYYKKLADQKIDLSIEQTLSWDAPSGRIPLQAPNRVALGRRDLTSFTYRESNQFSLHYHIVEAYMLFSYGKLTGDTRLIEIAKKMTEVINSYANSNGRLSAPTGRRSNSIGAEGYLMAGLLNKAFGNSARADLFLNYANGSRFFADPKYPNRLVWYDQQAKLKAKVVLNDDVSFVNMAELARLLFN